MNNHTTARISTGCRANTWKRLGTQVGGGNQGNLRVRGSSESGKEGVCTGGGERALRAEGAADSETRAMSVLCWDPQAGSTRSYVM